MIKCRNCEEWRTTAQWRGNCKEHPFNKDQWSEDAIPNDECRGKDYTPKVSVPLHQVAAKGGKA